MSREIVEANSFNGVGIGQTATLSLPVGAVQYHAIYLIYSTTTAGGATRANMEAEITEVRLMLNGRAQRTFSFKQAMDIYERMGISFSAGILPIYFSEPWRRAAQGEDVLAWPMGDMSTFVIEVDIIGTATAPVTLKALIVQDQVDAQLGGIVKWFRHTVPVPAIGEVDFDSLPKRDTLAKLHFFSADIAKIGFKVSNRQVVEFTLTPAQLDYIYLQHGGIAGVTGLTGVFFDFTNRNADMLPVVFSDNGQIKPVPNLALTFDMSAATSFTLLRETFGPRD